MNKCLDCGKNFDPNQKGASSLRGPVCNKKHLESWNIPNDVEEISQKLKDLNHPVYLVGGSVRDYLLGRKIKDYDLVTSASTKELETIFPNSLEVGKQFGIVKVPVKGDVVEIATFREDGEYSDGRRPDYIKEGTVDTDVQRRDFTINGLLFDLKSKEVIDKVEGIRDLNLKQIRCIGNPVHRFQEDQLRVLRAIRFATVLNFNIEPKTLEAAIKIAPLVKNVSKERIKVELDKTFDCENLKNQIENLKKIRVLENIFPFLKEKEISEIYTRISKVKNPSKELVYSWIFKKDMKLMNEHKLTNDEIKKVCELSSIEDKMFNFNEISLSEQNQLVYNPNFNSSFAFFKEYKPLSSLIDKRIDESQKNPINTSLLTSGKELIDYGFTPGANMGKLIKEFNDLVFSRSITSAEEKNSYILSKK